MCLAIPTTCSVNLSRRRYLDAYNEIEINTCFSIIFLHPPTAPSNIVLPISWLFSQETLESYYLYSLLFWNLSILQWLLISCMALLASLGLTVFVFGPQFTISDVWMFYLFIVLTQDNCNVGCLQDPPEYPESDFWSGSLHSSCIVLLSFFQDKSNIFLAIFYLYLFFFSFHFPFFFPFFSFSASD